METEANYKIITGLNSDTFQVTLLNINTCDKSSEAGNRKL